MRLNNTKADTCFHCLLFVLWVLWMPVTAAKASTGDLYETDDTFSEATVFNLVVEGADSQIVSDYDILPQQHDFHDAGDEDWVKFYGVTEGLHKGWYTIRADNPGDNCDVVIELFDSDGVTLLQSSDSGKEGDSEYMDWECPSDGVYYVRTRNYDPDVFGEDTGYELVIYWPIGTAGPVAVVTGMISDSDSSTGIDGAVIRTTDGGTSISADGLYVMIHPPGTYAMSVSAAGYAPANQSVTLASGQAVSTDFSLQAVEDDGACLFETLYGADSDQVKQLRRFRDGVLTRTSLGQQIIDAYYCFSPAAVTLVGIFHRVKETIIARLTAQSSALSPRYSF